MSAIAFDAATARMLEQVYLTPDIVGQRARVLELLAPRPGEHILDIGVGPGLLAHDLARLVGEQGRVVGLDASPDMLASAQSRLQPLAQAECLPGDAANLPLPDEVFDAAVSTQVYEYVAEMPRALSELRRVLRPGGRALILDTDWRSLVWRCSDQALMDRVLAVWDDHLADPHLPAALGPMLGRAGLTVRRVEIAPLLTAQWQPVSYAAGILRTIGDFVRKNGDRHGLSADDLAAWRADQDQLIASGEFFFSLNRYLFLATRDAS